MADVKLILTADNSQYVRKVREAQTATQNLHDTSERGMKREKGLIEDVEQELARLQERKKKAWTVDDIEKYNKKIAEAKRDLQEYDQAGVKAQKTTESLSQTIGKWALSLGGAAIALNLVKDAIIATTTGLNAFNIAGAAAKQVMYNLVTGAGDLTRGLTEVIAAQRELNRLRIQDKIDTYKAKIEQLKYNQALIEAKDQTKSVTDRIKSYDEAIAHKTKSTLIEVESTKAQIKAYEDILKASPDNEKAMMTYIDLQTKLVDLRIRETSSMKEISSMRSGLIKKQWEDQLSAWHNEIEEQNRVNKIKWDQEDRWADESLKIEQDVYDYIENLDKEYFALQDKKWLDEVDFQRKVFDAKKKGAKNVWNLMLENDKKREEDARKEEDLTKKRVDALQQGLTAMIDIMSSITDRALETAQRNREILDTRIAETQRSLEAEIELYKAGYASNVAAKQKEIDDLKKQREKALKAEEEAAKRQRALDTVIQLSSLVTASAETFKAFPGPLLPIAIAIVAAMFTAFGVAKAKAREATKLAKGGSGTDTGMVTGRTHERGGERFTDNIEVEHGESWGVLSVPASQKFGKVFHHMVSSFNKGEIPVITPVNKINNRVMVENNGPNTRLDQVIIEQRKLNQRLSGNEMIQETNGYRLVKRGNVTRIIKR